MNKKNEMRKCPVCGKKFTAKVSNQVYCSAACKKVAKAANDKARRSKGKKTVSGEKKPAPKAKPVAKKVEVKKQVKVAKDVRKTVQMKEKISLPKIAHAGVVCEIKTVGDCIKIIAALGNLIYNRLLTKGK